MQQFDYDHMSSVLEKTGISYNYPVYSSINNMSSFFATNIAVRFGYAAISDRDSVLIYSADMFSMMDLTNAVCIELPFAGIHDVKIKHHKLNGSYTVNIKGIAGGKKYHYRLEIPSKLIGKAKGKFPDQKENSDGFTDILQRWASR